MRPLELANKYMEIFYSGKQIDDLRHLFADDFSFGPVVAIVGLLLLIGWIFCVKTTFHAIGWLGVILGGAFFAAIIWFFVDLGWLNIENTGILTWMTLIVVSLILAVGMAWSHVKRRLTGQLNVDDVED